jgi:hypothetical protein
MKKKLLIALCVLLFIFVGKNIYGKLFAQQSNPGLTVVPSNIEIAGNPGTTVTKEITVINSTNSDFDIATSRRNFTALGEEGQAELTTDSTTFALVSWLKVSPEKITIKKSEKAKFVVAISIPKNAEPGGHFGSVVFSTVPKGGLKQTGAVVSQEVASLILVRINGEVNENAIVESFLPSKSFYSSGPVVLNARIKNLSTVHIKPEGKVIIKDIFGRKYEVPVESKNVLPGAIRRLAAGFNSHLLIGKYSADLTLAYGTQNNPLLTTHTTFWAFPVKTGLITLVVLIFVYLFRRRIFKALRILLIGK